MMKKEASPMNIALWVVQGLLALMFLFVGLTKAFFPLPTVKKNFSWANHVPGTLVRFIGVSELLGGLGLILPAVTHMLPWLTVAAAIGLALVMISAAIFHASRREFSMISFNIVLLLLAAFVVVGRVTLAPF
jgi:putative oxidoreductase